MGSYLESVGFLDRDRADFTRLFMLAKHEGEIITTSAGTYYRLGVPLPDANDYEIEVWLKETYDEANYSFNAHFVGATEGTVKLVAAFQPEGQPYDGAFRCTHNQLVLKGDKSVRQPYVFNCPNFDCGENMILPQESRVSFCGLGAGLTCYEDEADYFAQRKGPPPAYIFTTDIFRDDEICIEPVSPIAHITGWIEETEILTNPLTDREFTWAVVDVGMLGLVDIVAPPSGLRGYLHEGCVVTGTVILSGRLMEW